MESIACTRERKGDNQYHAIVMHYRSRREGETACERRGDNPSLSLPTLGYYGQIIVKSQDEFPLSQS
jgi:hypothetical protein